jgi:hypothetical protein
MSRANVGREKLTPRERHLLRAETLCAEETIDAWATKSRPVREATAARLDEAARKLGIRRSE